MKNCPRASPPAKATPATVVRQHFTGYEADSETGLNFAQARYQSNLQGRFTSVDPLGASASVGDPQSFNRYSYVENNPVNAIDPTGMSLADIGVLQTENPEEAKIAEHQSLRDLQSAINDDYMSRQEKAQQQKEEPQDVITINATGPRIVNIGVDLLNTVPGTGDEAPFAEVPIGGQFTITYTFSTAVGAKGQKPEDSGYVAGVNGTGTLGTGTTGAKLVSSKVIKSDTENNVTTVTKTDVFQVKRPEGSPFMGPSGTFQINYRVVVTNPNTNETVWTSSTGKRYPDKLNNQPKEIRFRQLLKQHGLSPGDQLTSRSLNVVMEIVTTAFREMSQSGNDAEIPWVGLEMSRDNKIRLAISPSYRGCNSPPK